MEYEIPIVEEDELTNCSKFEQLYLIGKFLGKIIPLKTIITKSIAEWKVVSEVSVADTGNGYNLH